MSRDEQVAAAQAQEVVLTAAEAQARRPGAVYNRVIGTVSTFGGREWPVDVTIYPLLFGRFRVCVGPCDEEEDGGFDWHQDVDTLEAARDLADGITRRDAQMFRVGGNRGD